MTVSSRYEFLVLDSIPAGCKRALDVGCGNGGLTRALRDRGVADVTGLDRDNPCIERCRSHPGAAGISYLLGDLLTQPPEPESFDLVSAVASLHHLDARAVLAPTGKPRQPGEAARHLAGSRALRHDAAPGRRTDSWRPIPAAPAVTVHADLAPVKVGFWKFLEKL